MLNISAYFAQKEETTAIAKNFYVALRKERTEKRFIGMLFNYKDMIELLKESHPIARKEHRCMFCGCIIPKGERYRRTTNKYDGDIYEFVTHEDCETVAHLLDMFSTDYDGVDECQFQEHIDEYLYENYHDKAIDDVREDVDKLSRVEQVRLIIAEWDIPRIKAKRLRYQIGEVKRQIAHIYSAEYLKLKESRLKELEEELIKVEGK